MLGVKQFEKPGHTTPRSLVSSRGGSRLNSSSQSVGVGLDFEYRGAEAGTPKRLVGVYLVGIRVQALQGGWPLGV